MDELFDLARRPRSKRSRGEIGAIAIKNYSAGSRALAKAAGVGKMTVLRAQRGEAISQTSARKLARELGVTSRAFNVSECR